MFRCAVLGLAVLVIVGTARGVEKVRYQQDEFFVGFFLDPPADEDLDARFREIKEANFNLPLVGDWQQNRREVIERKLALCEKYGFKCIVFPSPRPYAELPDSPACIGYGLADEPGVEQFEECAAMMAELREAKPGKVGIINLFPSYAAPWAQLGAPDYDTYVRKYMETVDPDVLCMDHYPQFIPGRPDTRDAYVSDLAVMRKYALKADIPWWNFFNVMPYGPHTDPTEAQIRWQMFASATYGARGLFYFCYWTPTFRGPNGMFEFPKGGAIIGSDGRRTRHYDEAKRLNARFLAMGPTLMKLTSEGVIRVTPKDAPAEKLAGSPIRDLTKADYDPAHNVLVGVFRHEDGRRAVMLMNYHFAYAAWPTVVFDGDPAEVLEVSQRDGEAAPVIDDSPELDGLQISLDAGEGRLFLLPPQ